MGFAAGSVLPLGFGRCFLTAHPLFLASGALSGHGNAYFRRTNALLWGRAVHFLITQSLQIVLSFAFGAWYRGGVHSRSHFCDFAHTLIEQLIVVLGIRLSLGILGEFIRPIRVGSRRNRTFRQTVLLQASAKLYYVFPKDKMHMWGSPISNNLVLAEGKGPFLWPEGYKNEFH